MLVNVTNDEWFGNSAALYQHAAMAPFRAVENGVPLLRCANTGLTEVIGPDGRVLARAPVFTAAVLRAPLPAARAGGTLWTRVGDWPGALALLATVALALARRRSKRDPAAAAALTVREGATRLRPSIPTCRGLTRTGPVPPQVPQGLLDPSAP